jgi:hypothetical protein
MPELWEDEKTEKSSRRWARWYENTAAQVDLAIVLVVIHIF